MQYFSKQTSQVIDFSLKEKFVLLVDAHYKMQTLKKKVEFTFFLVLNNRKHIHKLIYAHSKVNIT